MRDELKQHLDQEPFQPFRMVLTSGRSHDVTNPDLVALGESSIHVLVPQSDQYAILGLNQVASIGSLEPAH